MSAPSLSLRALLGRAAAQLSLVTLGPITSGLTPAAKAFAAAAYARGTGLTLLVVPTDKQIDPTVADARFFYGALEGASSDEVERTVLPFPSIQVDPYRGMHPHFRVSAARAQALYQTASGSARLIVASAGALLPRVASPARLGRAALTVHSGTEVEPLRLADLLVDAGFTRQDPVDEHGSFAVRGGIVDVFPAGENYPVRIEFVGDMVESLRRFDPATQRSIAPLDQVAIVPVRERFDDDDELWSVFDCVGAARGVHIVVSEPDLVEEHARRTRTQLDTSYADAVRRGIVDIREPASAFVGWDELSDRLDAAPRLLEIAIQDYQNQSVREVIAQPAVEFRGRVPDWIADIRAARTRGEQVLFVAGSAGRAERSIEILREYELVAVPVERAEEAHLAAVLVAVGGLSRGFRLPDARLQIYAETDVFEEERYATGSRPRVSKTFLSDLRELKVGDLIVHVDHGIGEFAGLKQLGVGGSEQAAQEFLELRYAGDDKLFVPVERLDLIQKYTGGARPALDRLGGTSWEKAKTRVKKAMRDMAEELLRLYAQRKAVPGHAFGGDTHWQEEFEGAFPFELTPDQATATAEIKKDMESPTPMDRLLCGDVGYGKTEVAVRAAFKAVMDGKQVAFLAPTTVLAFQHLKTLKERLAGFPVAVDMVSRFRSKAEIAEALAGVAAGKVDVIVGTHRLLSKDVVFRDLGLLVVDEEQRFGVAHKERIKQLRRKVDVLTMTATPIPRTLNMSLVGIRDMSVIETPPKDRLSIQTNVVSFDANVIERAVRAELARGGQIYFVHNRVESIASIGSLLQRLVPEARLVVGHGQMGEDELERAMLGFVEGRFDILLATTIVENGLDIPNANTIIINRADRYGLSQLYQLRGRVGRSDRPAYAYLLIPPEDNLEPVAKKRLAAIKEFSDLGSGFRVAALDLEIRGAGNLLGGEQSGHIDTVGFEMYMKLLEDAVRELKGETLEDDMRATVNLHVDLAIDDQYIPEMSQRLVAYRKVAEARSESELETVVAGIRDRYGPLTDSVLNLAEYGRIRVLADRIGIDSVEREGRVVAIKFGSRTSVDPARLIQIVRERPGLTLVPPGSLRLDLEAAARASGAVHGGAFVSSWWTSRARTGSVESGFSKHEVLRRPVLDPWAPGGLYAQLEGLLRALG